jgi:uncharacterized protein YrzB (UPF0473 family)
MAIETGEVFTLVDEQEVEHEVEVLGSLELDKQSYIAVAYVDDLEADAATENVDVFFFRVDEENDLLAIESDEEFDRVSKAFEAASAEE